MRLSNTRRRAFSLTIIAPLFVLVVGAWQVNVVPIAAWLPAEVGDELFASQLARDGIPASPFDIHRVHYLGLAAAHLGVIAALTLQLRRPRAFEAPMWQASVGLALSLATWPLVDSSTIPPFVPVVLLGVIAAGVLHPSMPLLRIPRPGDPLMALAAAAVGVPVLVFGLGQLRIQMAGAAGDPHWEALHYNFMAEYALQLTVAAWAGASRMRGWRWSVGIAAAMAALVGIGFAVHPHQASSRGLVWGMLLVGWALLWVALGRRRHLLERKTRARDLAAEAAMT